MKDDIEHPRCFFDTVDCYGDCPKCKMPKESKEMYEEYLREMAEMEMNYYHYCQRKDILHEDIPEGEIVRNNSHGFYRRER